MGAGRPPQSFHRKRSQGFAEGPKNVLGLKVGLKVGLKKEDTVDGANRRRQELRRALGFVREVGAVRF